MDKNTSFQLMALNWLLQTGDMEKFIVENVDKSCFVSPYQEIFESIVSYYEIHKKTPSKEYIVGLHPDFVSVIIEEPIETLLPFLKNVSAFYYLKNLQNWMFGPNAFPDNLLSEEKFIDIYDIIDATYTKKRAEFIKKSVSKPMHSMTFSDMKSQYCDSKPPIMIDTGYHDLQLRSDDGVMVIGASTGVGKTWALIRMAEEQAKKGKRVLFFGKEVPVIPTTERLLAQILHCSVDDLTWHLKKIPDDLDLDIIYVDHEQEKITTISDLRKAIMYYKPDILLFDDVTYLSPDCWDGKGKAEWEKTYNAMVDLRMLHHQTNVPIVVTDQLVKDCDKYQEPTTGDLSGSKKIADTCTLGIMLYRKDDKTIVKCFKDRFGDNDGKRFIYTVDYSTCTWTYEEELKDEDDNKDEDDVEIPAEVVGEDGTEYKFSDFKDLKNINVLQKYKYRYYNEKNGKFVYSKFYDPTKVRSDLIKFDKIKGDV